jgi:hypothetical protein
MCEKWRHRIREVPLGKSKMDAHLVGYGSSSDEEGKPKKHEIDAQKVGLNESKFLITLSSICCSFLVRFG